MDDNINQSRVERMAMIRRAIMQINPIMSKQQATITAFNVLQILEDLGEL